MQTKLIKTKDYLLFIDEEAEIKEEKLVVSMYEDDIMISKSLPNSDNLKRLKDKRVFLLIAYLPLNEEAKELDLPILPNPFEEDYEKVYVLLADGDGTMRSSDEPFGVAVKTKKAAEQYLKDGGVGYTHSYEELRVFNTAKEGIDWRYRKIEPPQSKGQYFLEDMKKAIEMAQNSIYVSRKTFSDDVEIKHNFTSEEIIQSLSTQHLPKEFIPEYEDGCMNYTDNKTCDKPCDNMFCLPKGKLELKTITNSKGKQELVGTWKFAE